MDFYHFRPSCKVIKRSRIIKSPILTNFDEETIKSIITNEKEIIREGRLRPEYFRNTGNFSRKVFVGGLPKNTTEESVIRIFSKFGHLNVDWPYKENSFNVVIPPKGFVFLLFEENISVDHLLDSCQKKGDEYFLIIPKDVYDKKIRVQIRPWKLFGVDHFFVPVSQMNKRLAAFIGGVPRTLSAEQIGTIMARLFGDVAYVGIDIDPLYSYPKGSARVIFLEKNSLISAVKKRFVMPAESNEDTRKMMEIKPYVLDDQICDRCHRVNLDDGMSIPAFLCPEPECLSYFCDFCWMEVHSSADRRTHRPLVKQGREDYAHSLRKRGFEDEPTTTVPEPSVKYRDRDVDAYSLLKKRAPSDQLASTRQLIVKQGRDNNVFSVKTWGLENPSMNISDERIVEQNRDDDVYLLETKILENLRINTNGPFVQEKSIEDYDANSLIKVVERTYTGEDI